MNNMTQPNDHPGYGRSSPLLRKQWNINDRADASTEPSDSHWLSGTVLGIQRKHMPKQAQSLFLRDDTILFKPREQADILKTRSKTRKPGSLPDHKDSDVCIACQADWLLAFFGLLVLWAMYSSSDQWFDAWKQDSAGTVPVPLYIVNFWRTLTRVTLLWCLIFGILVHTLWIIFNVKTWCDDDPLPHCLLVTHLACHVLSTPASYVGFCWNHGRQSERSLLAKKVADVDRGAVLLRLSPYPDVFTTRFLGWFNDMYLTHRDWQRWNAARVVYAELERDGKLCADAPFCQSLVEVNVGKYVEKNARLSEEAGYLYLEF
ncbi:hypothetical protein BR93DRAFT_361882 [Coniochaeta sp. PMI_546]|nr:hypothetical protein BR93DRAFT_361882 [Coniochaeta sp. PMI_546]